MFEFRLALALGKSVAELRQSMTSEELTLWLAYTHVEPLPERRADIRAAVVAHASAAPHLKERMKVEDFLPQWGENKPKVVSAKVARELMQAWAEQHNSNIRK